MDQSILVDAIGKHLDLLEKISVWALLLSLAIGWAGLQKKDIAALGMTFARREAFAAAAAVYLFANMIIIVLFLRLGDLLLLVDAGTLPQAITKLSTHTWIMNPYSYFGGYAFSRTYSCEGFGLLIVLWWLCHASLGTLIDGSQTKKHTLLIGAFLLLGLAAMFAVQRVGWIVLHRGAKVLPTDLFDSISSTFPERTIETFLGIGIGGFLFGVVRVLQRRWKGAESPPV
jgi:hypothetical protein